MDDMGNTESSYFIASEPEELKLERHAEKAMVKGGQELLENIIDRFKAKVAFYDSVDSIQTDPEITPEEHQKIVMANKLTKANLKAELDYLTDLKELYE